MSGALRPASLERPAEPSVAVLVPCYNEGKTIGALVRGFQAALPRATVYVYDNNSTDDTVARAREAGAVVRREPLQGRGTSFAGCSRRWRPTTTSWWMVTTPTTRRRRRP